MNETDALELIRQSIWTVMLVSGPAVGSAMMVGIVISLIQALTQVQEATLTFVPKILAVLLVLAASAPFMAGELSMFSEVAFSRIETGFGP